MVRKPISTISFWLLRYSVSENRSASVSVNMAGRLRAWFSNRCLQNEIKCLLIYKPGVNKAVFCTYNTLYKHAGMMICLIIWLDVLMRIILILITLCCYCFRCNCTWHWTWLSSWTLSIGLAFSRHNF